MLRAFLLSSVAVLLLLGVGCTRGIPTAPTNAPAEPAALEPPLGAQPSRTAQPSAPPPVTAAIPTAPLPAPQTAAPAPTPTPKVFRITATQWEFTPKDIRVQRGDRVILEVTSRDVPHGFGIVEYGINRTLPPGITERIAFTADKVGRFSVACTVYCGRGHSDMQGVLLVE